MVEKWFRSKPKSASAERCLRFLGAMKPIATSEMALSNRSIVCVTGVLSHCGLRKANCKMGVVTGIRSLPGIAVDIQHSFRQESDFKTRGSVDSFRREAKRFCDGNTVAVVHAGCGVTHILRH